MYSNWYDNPTCASIIIVVNVKDIVPGSGIIVWRAKIKANKGNGACLSANRNIDVASVHVTRKDDINDAVLEFTKAGNCATTKFTAIIMIVRKRVIIG